MADFVLSAETAVISPNKYTEIQATASEFSRATFFKRRFLIKTTMKNDPLQNELREMLSRLPDAPVASNFTARVLQTVELEESRRSRHWSFSWNWHALLPRIAVTAAVILFAGLAVRQHEIAARRTAFARNVALIAGAQPLPSVDALKNFDAIQRMSQPRADEELLALMQ
jgi:hypothetical protein